MTAGRVCPIVGFYWYFSFFLLLFSEAFPPRELTARGTPPESFGPRVNSPTFRRFDFLDFLLIIRNDPTVPRCRLVINRLLVS